MSIVLSIVWVVILCAVYYCMWLHTVSLKIVKEIDILKRNNSNGVRCDKFSWSKLLLVATKIDNGLYIYGTFIGKRCSSKREIYFTAKKQVDQTIEWHKNGVRIANIMPDYGPIPNKVVVGEAVEVPIYPTTHNEEFLSLNNEEQLLASMLLRMHFMGYGYVSIQSNGREIDDKAEYWKLPSRKIAKRVNNYLESADLYTLV